MKTSILRIIAPSVFALCLSGVAAHAQIAKVTAAQQVVEKRAGAAWKKAPVGTGLATGDRLRTGKRSKSDVKFTDGSLIRLGQLSALEIRAEKEATLSSGKLLFSFLKPGRILAGAGAAEIKGTVGLIEQRSDGSTLYVCYSGAIDVVTEKRSVSLRPGKQLNVKSDGTIGPITDAAPLGFAQGRQYSELLETPIDAPYIGSRIHQLERNSGEQRSVQTAIDQAGGVLSGGNNNQFDGDPYPIPFPENTAAPVPTAFPTFPPPGGGGLGTFPRTRAASKVASPTEKTRRLAVSRLTAPDPILFAQAAPSPREVPLPGVNPGAGAAQNYQNGAENHLNQVNTRLGRDFGFDARALAAVGDEGQYPLGGRFHAYGTKGKWFLDGAVTPLRTERSNGVVNSTDTVTTISDLSATYRDDFGDIQVGRQRYLAGPTQATFFGSLVRAGGRDIMDGIRFAPKIGPKDRVEISYLYDAFPRDLPFQIGGRQKGFFGRYAHFEKRYNLGINLLKYTNSPVSNTLGGTLDFSYAIAPNKLEFYGEIGRDPFRRDLRSFGLYFPGIYQKTGFDVFLEYAKLDGSSAVAGVSSEYAIRVYKKLNKNVDFLATGNHFSGGGSSLILGISVGSAIADER